MSYFKTLLEYIYHAGHMTNKRVKIQMYVHKKKNCSVKKDKINSLH